MQRRGSSLQEAQPGREKSRDGRVLNLWVYQSSCWVSRTTLRWKVILCSPSLNNDQCLPLCEACPWGCPAGLCLPLTSPYVLLVHPHNFSNPCFFLLHNLKELGAQPSYPMVLTNTLIINYLSVWYWQRYWGNRFKSTLCPHRRYTKEHLHTWKWI